MRQNITTYGLCLLTLLSLLVGCRKEPIEQPRSPKPQQSIQLDLSGAIDEAKTLDFYMIGEDKTSRPFLQPIGIPTIHCFLRRPTSGAEVYHIALAGEYWNINRGLRGFSIKTKSSVEVGIEAQGMRLTEGEWLFAAFIGGSYEDGQLRFSPGESYDDHFGGESVSIDIPYSTSWQRVTVENRGTDQAPSLWLQRKGLRFAPMGSLIRVRLTSEIDEEVGERSTEIGQLALISEDPDFGGDVSFDPTKAKEGDRPTMVNNAPGRSVFPYRVYASTPSSMDKQYRPNYRPVALLWGMNLSKDQTKNIKFRISALGYKLRAEKLSSHIQQGDYSVLLTRPMPSGTSGYINVTLVRPKTPLEYIADANLSPTPKQLADPNDSFHSGYYDLGDIYKNAQWEQENLPDGMYLPGVDEWQTLFPGVMSPQYIRFDGDYARQTCVDEATLAGVLYTAKSEYKGVDRGDDRYEVYALCFQPISESPILGTQALHTRKFLTAIKYEFFGPGELTGFVPKEQENPDGYTLRVTSYYLGTSSEYQHVTLNAIAHVGAPGKNGKAGVINRKLFHDPDPEGRRRVVYFPMTGYGIKAGGRSAKSINLFLQSKAKDATKTAYEQLIREGCVTDNRIAETADSYYVLKGQDREGSYWHLVLNKQNGIGRGPNYGSSKAKWDAEHYPVVRPFVRFAR